MFFVKYFGSFFHHLNPEKSMLDKYLLYPIVLHGAMKLGLSQDFSHAYYFLNF